MRFTSLWSTGHPTHLGVAGVHSGVGRGAVSGRLASWDDVLGKRHKNSRKRAAARWQWELRYPVWHKVRRLNAGDGIGISDELFQIVAEQFGLTKRNVSELYHRMQRSGGRHANIFPPHRRKRRPSQLLCPSKCPAPGSIFPRRIAVTLAPTGTTALW